MPKVRDKRSLWIRQAGRDVQGPFPISRVHTWIEQGKIRETMDFSIDGENWMPGSAVPGLFEPLIELAQPTATASAHVPMAVATTGAAVVVLVSLAMPIASVFGVSVAGYEAMDGVIFAVLAALALLGAGLVMSGKAGRKLMWLPLVCLLLATGAYILDAADLPPMASAGAGLYIGALASAAGVVCSLVSLRRKGSAIPGK